RRIHGSQHQRPVTGLPAKEETLLISAREMTDANIFVGGPDVKGGDERPRHPARRRPAHEWPAADWRHAIVAQHRVLRDAEGRHQALAEPILRDIRDSALPSLARTGPRDVPSVQK